MPFMKASNVVAPAKQVKVAPDLEEAFEEEDEGEIIAEVGENEEEELDLKKDKYIKQPKAKKAAAGKKAAPKKNKSSKDEEDDADDLIDDGEEEKPKKGRGKAKAGAAKGEGKK